jgi:hypothetical protein
MVRLAKDLPEFVLKTKTISDTAQRVLKAVRDARQPDKLLFADLPVACDHPPFESAGRADPKQIDTYFAQLRGAFTELQRAYPHLLTDIERLTLKAFNEEPPLPAARKRIDHHARLVLNVAVDAKLKAFLLRTTDDGMEDNTWLESLATLLAGKPPAYWDDQDRARFEVQLAAATRTFDHYRVLAVEMEKGGHPLLDGEKSMLLVSITTPGRGEVERVVQVPPQLQDSVPEVKSRLRRVLADSQMLDRKEIGVAVLADLVRQLLTEDSGH